MTQLQKTYTKIHKKLEVYPHLKIGSLCAKYGVKPPGFYYWRQTHRKIQTVKSHQIRRVSVPIQEVAGELEIKGTPAAIAQFVRALKVEK